MPDLPLDIQYLPHAAIDKRLWDIGIQQSANSMVYAQANYLDAMCEGWDALVANNYEFLMPLPWKKKWGWRYLYQPFGIGQGGVFSSKQCTPDIVQLFVDKAMSHFYYGNLDLNEANDASLVTNAAITMRDNYVLPLSSPYEKLKEAYNKDAKKNLRFANTYHHEIRKDIAVSEVIAMYKAQYGMLNKAEEKDYNKLAGIVNSFATQNKAIVIGLQAEEACVAAAIFLIDNHRLYYILGAPSQKGKALSSMHLLIDYVISLYSNSHYTLDFEGSDIPSVATFYKKFSPENRQYPHLHFNRLPIWAKLFKR